MIFFIPVFLVRKSEENKLKRKNYEQESIINKVCKRNEPKIAHTGFQCSKIVQIGQIQTYNY